MALTAALACLAVKYRRRRALYRAEETPARRTSVLQEVGQTIKKKLSVISGSIPYTETVPGSESVENLREHTHLYVACTCALMYTHFKCGTYIRTYIHSH